MRTRALLFIVCLLAGISYKQGQAKAEERHLLEQSISYEALGQALICDQSWVEFPAYSNREAWQKGVDPAIARLVIKKGERALKHVWTPHRASDYLAFKRTGEILTGRENHRAAQDLMLAELVEGKGRFIDALIDGVWFLCETSWIHSAHLSFQKDRSGLPDWREPTVELVVADIGAQLAWTYYFFHEEFDKVSPLINLRIREVVYKNLINPYFERDDYWWMGFSGAQVNNWNPWINYNMLQALLLMETDPKRLQECVWKIMKSVDYFFSMYKDDGACDEGPTYWSASSGYAFKFLDLLARATSEKVNIFDNPLLRNMAQYIYRVHIGNNYFTNFADSSPHPTPSPGLVYGYGKRIGDPQMMGFAAFLARQNESFKKGISNYLPLALDELFLYRSIMDQAVCQPLIREYWFKDTQICVARDREGKTDGFFFAAKGGHNAESHNHNDIGSCILYYNCQPLLIDVGVGTYTRQTFGPERYSIWTMQSDYHNLPTINGTGQKNGKQYVATNAEFNATSRKVTFAVNIAKAYPESSDVKSWVRRYTLNRGKNLTISDHWALKICCQPTVLNFMTCCPVTIDGKGNVTLKSTSGDFVIEYDKKLLAPETDTIKLSDKKLEDSWNNAHITRIRFVMRSCFTSGHNTLVIKKQQ